MTVRFFQTPGGEELAVLPKAEYEALAALAAESGEDAADVAMYDARKSLNSPVLPSEVSALMLRGDNLLRAVRKWRGLTQQIVEARTSVGQGYLSDLENGRRKGSPEVLEKIATALDVPKEWLIGG